LQFIAFHLVAAITVHLGWVFKAEEKMQQAVHGVNSGTKHVATDFA
jgi:hypothetical protein